MTIIEDRLLPVVEPEGLRDYSPKGLLKDALVQIQLHPETWDQSDWRCDTGFCLAGWFAQLDPRVDWESDDVGDPGYTVVVEHATRRRWPVEVWFRDQLGLDPWESNRITDGHNELWQLEYMVDDVLRGEAVGNYAEDDEEYVEDQDAWYLDESLDGGLRDA